MPSGRTHDAITFLLAAPIAAGAYGVSRSLSMSAVVATVIQQGSTGVPFWKVDKALPGTLSPLTVIVSSARPRK